MYWTPAQVNRLPDQNSEFEKQKPVFYIMVADVEAFHPSLCRDAVTKALKSAMEKHFIFNTRAYKIIAELNKKFLNTLRAAWFRRISQKKTAVFGCLTNVLAPPPIVLESCSVAQTDRPV